MMVFHTACIILLILFGISPQIVYSQNVVYVDYVESFNEMHDTNMVSLPIINKKNRLKSSVFRSKLSLTVTCQILL